MMWTIHHIVDVCVCLCLASGCHDNRYMTVRVLSRITTRRELSRHTLPWRVEFWFQSIPGHFIYRDGSHRWISTIYFFSHHPQGFNIVWAFFFFWMIDLSFCVCACVCLFCYFFMSFFSDWSIDRFECCERVGTKTHKSYSHQYIYCPSNSRFYIQFSQQCFTHTQTHNQYRPYTFSISYFLLICFYTIFNDIYTFNGIHATGHQRDSLSYFLLFLLFHTWLFANKHGACALWNVFLPRPTPSKTSAHHTHGM